LEITDKANNSQVESEQLDFIEAIMKDFKYPWFIAGGWSIDLGIGKITRVHEDMDICIFRENIAAILTYFIEWDIINVTIPGESRLEKVTTIRDTESPRYCLHLTKGQQFIEILLTDNVDGQIPYRRDSSIKISHEDFVRTDDTGRNYIAPELQLLYKASSCRPKDQLDFENFLPVMSSKQIEWLRVALMKAHPTSSWIQYL